MAKARESFDQSQVGDNDRQNGDIRIDEKWRLSRSELCPEVGVGLTTQTKMPLLNARKLNARPGPEGSL